jgi:hypothetical protein
MSFPKVSIIILNWNGLEDTIECLESVGKITYPNYEVVVVDNGSEGNDAGILEDKYKGCVKVLRSEKNYGFAAGNNMAMKWLLENSGPMYFLLLNNDTVVHPEFLSRMIGVASGSPEVGVVGPKTYYYDDNCLRIQFTWAQVDLGRGRVFVHGINQIDRGRFNQIRETDYVQGSCLLVKREVVEKIGLLDCSYFGYWEDTEYCLRAKKSGYTLLYCPDAIVWHKGLRSARKVKGFYCYHVTRNRFWTIRRYASRRQLVTFLLWFFVRDLWFNIGALVVYRRDIMALPWLYRGVRDGLLGKPVTGIAAPRHWSR